MLPAPAFSKRAHGSIPTRLATLRHRSRVTNLAVLILIGVLSLSLLLNLKLYFTTVTPLPITHLSHTAPQHQLLDSGLSTISGRVSAKNLIVVAGHAIWKGCLPERRLDDNDWILEEYQKGTRSITAFFSHIVRGAEAALADQDSLLVFSGGHTRGTSTASEGESYYRLAIESNLFHNGFMPFERATSEDHSLDSFQNLLFSVARFYEVTGGYPEHITVIGFEMKRRRFEKLHIRALKWPQDRFTYVGIDEEGDTTLQYEGEVGHDRRCQSSAADCRFVRQEENGYLPFSRDLYGCHGELLEKRRRRNPSFRFHPYYTSAPELTGLLKWCPDKRDGGMLAVFPRELPWDNL